MYVLWTAIASCERRANVVTGGNIVLSALAPNTITRMSCISTVDTLLSADISCTF